jgi:hypothetical protein
MVAKGHASGKETWMAVKGHVSGKETDVRAQVKKGVWWRRDVHWQRDTGPKGIVSQMKEREEKKVLTLGVFVTPKSV